MLYSFGLGFGLKPYMIGNSLINYKWNTFVDNGVIKLKDSGKSPKYNAEINSGKGVLFNGTDQSVTTTQSTGSIGSIICTVTIAVDNGSELIAGAWSPNRAYISINPSKYIAFGIGGQSWSTTGQTYERIVVGKTYNLCLTWDGFVATLYNDGVQVAQNTYSGSTINPILFGTGGYYCSQIVKDTYCFSDLLTQQEIAKHSSNPNDFFQDVQDGVIDNCVLNIPMDGTDASVHDYANNTDYTISNYTTSVRDTTSTLNYGSQEMNFIRDGLWRGDLSNYLQMSGSAQTGYSPSGTFQIEEVTRNDVVTTHRVYSSDGSKFTDGVSDGTFTVPSTPIILSNVNIESIAIDEYRLFKVHTKLQNPLDLYIKAVNDGLVPLQDALQDANGNYILDANGNYIKTK